MLNIETVWILKNFTNMILDLSWSLIQGQEIISLYSSFLKTKVVCCLSNNVWTSTL